MSEENTSKEIEVSWKSLPLEEKKRLYCIWLSFPKEKEFSREELRQMSEEEIELIKIKTKSEFSRKFDISPRYLYAIEGDREFQRQYQESWKKWARKLTPNVIKIMYEKIKEEPDAAIIGTWFKTVEDVKENQEVGVTISFDKIKERLENANGDQQENK